VLAQYRREHPNVQDVELISYGMNAPRPELCTAASRAAGAAWQAQMAMQATQQAREAAMPLPVSELLQERRTEQAPAKDATPPVHSPEPVPQPPPRHNDSPSEPWLGPHTWMNR